jgi:hypothetical protein
MSKRLGRGQLPGNHYIECDDGTHMKNCIQPKYLDFLKVTPFLLWAKQNRTAVELLEDQVH